MSRRSNPRLIAIEGPLQGQTFALDEGNVGIGRDPANLLAIQDSAVSRRHCLLQTGDDGRFAIRDLDSKNGTFVNGLPVSNRILDDRDELRVGKSLFVFRITDEESVSEGSVRFDNARLPSEAVTLVQGGETLHLDPQSLIERSAAGGIPRGLLALVRICATMQTIRNTDELARQLLAMTFEVLPAQRGVVLLFEAGCDEPAWTYVLDRDQGPGGMMEAHLPIVAQVMHEGVAILSGAPAVRSGSQAFPRHVLAAPIVSAGHSVGVIYLEAVDPRVYFDRKHLEFITTIGAISGTAIENARRVQWLESENLRLRQEVHIEHDMVGTGPRIREVFQFISKVAPTESTVLLCGESGTGKELVARAIHRNSPRADGPFVAINCATLSDTLLESELFGHEKGAFTGAFALRKGKFELAAGGTIFLDEVSEVPLPLQAKLLRVLQEREFDRLGGNRPIKANVRVVAATNRDLESGVTGGVFRQDLYYRLNVLRLTLPALRDRRDDIPALAAHFADKHANRSARRGREISPEALACLLAYDWPGNVRELENAIERAVVLGASDIILPEDLPEAVLETARATAAAPIGSYQQTISEEKKRVILNAFAESGGVFTEAAKLLGVHPNYLHRLVRNLNLKGDIKKLGAA